MQVLEEERGFLAKSHEALESAYFIQENHTLRPKTWKPTGNIIYCGAKGQKPTTDPETVASRSGED